MQSANSASPLVIRSGSATNVSQNAVQQAATPSAGTMHVQCVPMSASGISVVPQPAGGSTVPAQPIRVLQASSVHPQVVHQPQQYQVMPQQQQGNAGLTLIQTASGQLVLQQPQAPKPTESASINQAQIVINSGNSQRVNYGGLQGVQLAGGIQLQSAVAAQPLVVQQQSVTPSNRNIIVQTLPVVSAANSPIQLGGTVARPANASLPNRSGQPASSNPAADPNGMLIQIGGQTYRVQGVQQVQVVNAVRPSQQPQPQPHQQIAPATPSQPSALSRQIHMATPIQPSAAISQLNAATPSQLSLVPGHATLATHGQSSTVPKQLTLASSSQPSAANIAGQTITLTSSQLALLKQTPPEKQLGMIQQFQRQAAQRSAAGLAASSGTNSAAASPVKSVQIVNSVVGSSPHRTPLSTQTARLSAPTIIRAGPPITVRVGQNPSSSMAAGNTHTAGMQILRPKTVGEINSTTVVGQCH